MGTWGPLPHENDTAADFCDMIDATPLPKLIRNGLHSSDYDDNRIAAFLLAQVGYNYIYPLENLGKDTHFAIKKLKVILNDSEWMKAWKDDVRDKVREDLINTLKKLEDLYFLS